MTTSQPVPPMPDQPEKAAVIFGDDFDARMRATQAKSYQPSPASTPTDPAIDLLANAGRLTEAGKDVAQAAAKKGKGVAQVVAGGAIAAAGVPMLVLPGPGIAAIAGGIGLASHGLKNLRKEAAEELAEPAQGSPESEGLLTQRWESPVEEAPEQEPPCEM